MRPASGVVESDVADRVHHPHRIGGLGGRPVEFARQVPSADRKARRRWPACSDVIVMPCPKVGLKLATASPNGTIPAGKRSSLS